MPFVSEKQRSRMYQNKPELAKEFESATPKWAKLPVKHKKIANIKKAKPLTHKKK